MTAIHFNDLSFQYSSAVPVFADVSLSLGPGWAGIVGVNGAGKTTLIRLVDGSLVPSSGSITLDPADGVLVHCPQTAEAIDENIVALRDAWDGTAHALIGRLGLDRIELERWETLSPGERKRWQVGGALYRRPDVLLVDEPTNHLDAHARDLLIEALRSFSGVGMVVSHDRTVLNTLCARVVRIAAGRVELWNGNYDTARRGWEAHEAEVREGYERVVAERKKAQRRLSDKRRAGATKEARHRRQLRTAGIKDKDARSMEKKGRFEGGQRQGSHEMSLLRDEVERLDNTASEFEMQRQLGGDLYFDYEPPRRSRLLSFGGPLRIGGQTLVEEVDVSVDRGDRVLLRGPNGAGKSTLMQAMLKSSSLPKERILHLPQELSEAETVTLMEDVAALDPETRGRVLGIVGVLGSDPKRVLATDLPSPGEARKLLIASGLGTSVWVLLLDEPTNHLDLPSIERLERALESYPGAVVVITHDDHFARHTVKTVWNIDHSRLTRSGVENGRM